MSPAEQGTPPSRARRRPRALRELYLARLREFVREPGVIFWVFGFPMVMSAALGLAFRNKGPERAPVLVAASSTDPAPAQAIAEALATSPLLLPTVRPAEDAAARWRRGEAMVLVTPGTPPVSAYDPTCPGADAAAAAVTDALERAAGRKDVVGVRSLTAVAPGQRYIDFLLPGLLGIGLMGGGIWGVGYALVSLRVRKLLKRLAATPMSRPAFLGSFLLHRLVVATVESAFLLTFGWFAFGVEVRGSVALAIGVSLLGALTFSGLGLLAASRARNMETANGLMNLSTLPMWLLSGVFFSTANFPSWMRPLVAALPLTALNDALRQVINDGAGVVEVLPRIGILLAWAAACFLTGLKVFRWS